MWWRISKEELEYIRETYPAGTRVELVKMDDLQAPPVGTKGTVKAVDDLGDLIMEWHNGSHLKVLRDEDVVRRLSLTNTDMA